MREQRTKRTLPQPLILPKILIPVIPHKTSSKTREGWKLKGNVFSTVSLPEQKDGGHACSQ